MYFHHEKKMDRCVSPSREPGWCASSGPTESPGVPQATCQQRPVRMGGSLDLLFPSQNTPVSDRQLQVEHLELTGICLRFPIHGACSRCVLTIELQPLTSLAG